MRADDMEVSPIGRTQFCMAKLATRLTTSLTTAAASLTTASHLLVDAVADVGQANDDVDALGADLRQQRAAETLPRVTTVLQLCCVACRRGTVAAHRTQLQWPTLCTICIMPQMTG